MPFAILSFISFTYVLDLPTPSLFTFLIFFCSFLTSTAFFLILFDPTAFFDPFYYRGFPADGLALLPPNWSSSRAVE